MYRLALELKEKVLGKEHPSILDSINSLVIILKGLRKYEEGEQMYRQILELWEKVLGKEYPSTLGSMNNLVIILKSLGKYKEVK